MLESFNSETVFEDLRIAAAQAGTNLTQVCQDAGIPRNTVEAWKGKTPKSIVLLGKLSKAIADRAASSNKEGAAE